MCLLGYERQLALLCSHQTFLLGQFQRCGRTRVMTGLHDIQHTLCIAQVEPGDMQLFIECEGSATALELAQQKSLVAAQQRQLPLIAQQAQDARITLAVLLGKPVSTLAASDTPFSRLRWPDIGSGVPSELLTRRPDIASAEAKLAAARADVSVARAAMLPSLTLSASLGSGADRLSDVLRSPFYNLTAGLAGPIFNNGRLSAERDKATARQQELLQTYRASVAQAAG